MKSILLIEDDPFIRDITSVKLSEQSYAVQTASDGESALEIVKREQPDLVLLDLDLPGMPGLQFLTELKADPLLKSIPVIIFSNNDNPDIKAAADKEGVAGFFVKATTVFDDLHTHIKSVIGE